MTPEHVLEEEIEAGLKYTEEAVRIERTHPVRYCYLWRSGVDAPVSDLEVHAFHQRFGAVALPAEGIGGVETLPQFRRQGLLRKLLTRVMADAAKRVAVLFVSDGIEEIYEQFGFVNCLAEAALAVPVRNVERMVKRRTWPATQRVRDFAQTDLPAIINLYNEMHAHRPWTHERAPDWNRLVATQIWRSGSEVLILEREGRVVGYAIWQGQQFGHPSTSFVVDELTASDAEAACALLGEMAERCWQRRLSEFRVWEPLDSVVGWEAQKLGCDYAQTFLPSGGMLGAILDRQRLLSALEPELRRRLPSHDLNAMHATAFAALLRGELVPDNQVLLRLLLGNWSMNAAIACGTVIPVPIEPVCEAWFPGGGTRRLLRPYAHKLDRY